MAGLVPNETVTALAPLHTNIQWLGIRPFQHDPDCVAFMVQTKNTQREFSLRYRIIQPLSWRRACLIFNQLKRTITPVSDLIREADTVSRILRGYEVLPGLGAGDAARLHAARVQLDRAIQSLNFAGQVGFPDSLFDTRQRALKFAAVNAAKHGVFTAIHQIEVGFSEETAMQLGVSAYRYSLNRMALKSVLNAFNLYRFAFHEKLLE